MIKVKFLAAFDGPSDLSECCNGPLFHILDESVVVFGRFVIRTFEYDINRGTNFSPEYKVIRGIASRFVSGASVCCHGKRQTNVPVFLVFRDGLGKDAIHGSVKSFDLVCRKLTRSRPELFNVEQPAFFVHVAAVIHRSHPYGFWLVSQKAQ